MRVSQTVTCMNWTWEVIYAAVHIFTNQRVGPLDFNVLLYYWLTTLYQAASILQIGYLIAPESFVTATRLHITQFCMCLHQFSLHPTERTDLLWIAKTTAIQFIC